MKKGKRITGLVKRSLTHLVLWLIVVIFFSFFLGIEGADIYSKIIFSLFFLPVTIATTYTFLYHLIPKYLLPKHYFKFGLFTLYTLVISSIFIILSAFYGFVIALELQWNANFPISKSLFFIIITIYLVVAIASAFSLLKNNYSATAKNEELKNRILEAQLKLKDQELQYLKMQIHPHFLFNTLNTIYGLSLSKNEKTPEMILQLSDLLDYILYQTTKPSVKLEEEINHIRNYIDLEKKRFQDALEIEFKSDQIPSDIELAPMLLLPFVENSFKHGKGNDGKLKISICIKLENKQLDFKIINSVKPSCEYTIAEGIGLENIRRRLNLLYGKNYELRIEDEKEYFSVNLKVNTAKMPADVR
ncbi:sensor histidine kinase [Christiangramia sediminis]|uniref:Histidine kinase n=1 Tax=Christiangramia sediminis TaxID=2881336 RepID=A0A9X1LI32_9FLAO|nr:histidine kinase [Christiangramia sediminis]MCB7480744.1 histidine kinase [Christiangramia sediminis]